jgi:hypothetical protein
MNGFSPVDLEYNGKTYTVESNRVWGLIQSIESVIGRAKLAMRLADMDPPETKIGDAYASALRYAGAKGVTGQDITRGRDLGAIVELGMRLFEIMSIAEDGMPKLQATSETHEKKAKKSQG